MSVTNPFDRLVERCNRVSPFDHDVVCRLDRLSEPVLRCALGVVFLWFGALKLTGPSPATDLVTTTVSVLQPVVIVPPTLFVPVLGVVEVLIGLCLLYRPLLRVGLVLLFLQLPATFLPLVLLPEITFTQVPYGLSMHGQYVVKNLVFVAGALTLVGTIHRRSDRTSHQRESRCDADDERDHEPGGDSDPGTGGYVARFDLSTSHVSASDRVIFKAKDATGEDRWIRTLRWDFGDGTTDTGWWSEHAYVEPGTYTVALTANDDNDETTTYEVDVTVS